MCRADEDIVIDGENGYLYDLQEPERFVEACVRLAKDPEHSRKLGLAARISVTQRYAWRDSASAYLELLK